MSIIHDALKKVQQTSNPGAVPPPPSYQAPVPPPEQPKPQDKISIPLLVAAICAVVAMIFAALPQLAPKKTAAPAAVTVQAPEAMPQVPAAPQKGPAAPKPAAASPAPSENTMSQAIANAVASPVIPALKPPAQKIVDPNDPLSSIQIEGVIDMDGKKAVLISGNIYEEGQTIYGRIISEITFDALTVIENGQKRTFAIKP